MNLNNKIICFNFETLDLVKEHKYEREIRREFYQKPKKRKRYSRIVGSQTKRS